MILSWRDFKGIAVLARTQSRNATFMSLLWENSLKSEINLALLVRQKIEWRALIHLDESRSRLASVNDRHRACVATQPLKMIERHPEEMRHAQADRVGMKNNRDNIFRLVVFLDDSLERVCASCLRLYERLAIGEPESRWRILHDLPNFRQPEHAP